MNTYTRMFFFFAFTYYFFNFYLLIVLSLFCIQSVFVVYIFRVGESMGTLKFMHDHIDGERISASHVFSGDISQSVS